jgi:hypothetical protein
MAERGRPAADTGHHLVGNVGGAWRIGNTVRRRVGPWTPAVHTLLEYLSTRIDYVPRVLGFDDHGREMLSFLPGRVVDIDTELLTAPQIESVVTWTRRFHEAVAGFNHPGPWRYAGMPEPTLIGHNDIAPYNVCFDGDELVGVFDWDLAGPSSPLMELAFIAWNGVPLWRDVGAQLTAERLGLIASVYGIPQPLDILHAVPHRIQSMLDWIPAAAASGDQGMVNLMTCGEPERSRRSLDDLVLRIPRIAALIG